MDLDFDRDDPFSITPNPNRLYLTKQIHTSLFKIRATIKRRQGLTCVLGDVGYGKSTLLRYMHSEYSSEPQCEARMIPTPNYATDFAFLKAISAEFGLPSKRAVLDQESLLRAYLIEQYVADRIVILFIDEGQRLSNKMLEVVRSLLNFETDEVKLIQVVIAGQLDLYERLLRPASKAIRSRIVMPTLLEPLTRSETREMLEHRCQHAGVRFPFNSDAVGKLFDLSDGVPRELLKLARASYDVMGLANAPEVTAEIVDAARQDASLQDNRG